MAITLIRMKKTLIILCTLLSSCYEYHQLPNSYYFDRYKALSEHQVVVEFGPPDKTTSDGSGGKIIEYRKTSDPYTITAIGRNFNNTPYSVSRTHVSEWYLQFYISKHDSVYLYRSNLPGPVEKIKINRPPTPPDPFGFGQHK